MRPPSVNGCLPKEAHVCHINGFLKTHDEWYIHQKVAYCNGMTYLARVPTSVDIVPIEENLIAYISPGI